MSQTLLISGPPGYGKTSWILNRIQSHPGPCGCLRLAGYPDEGLPQARDGGIDLTWLQDQCPGLLDLADPDQALAPRPANLLALIELPQFQPPEGLNACNCSYPSQLAERRDRLLFVHGSPNSQHAYLLPDMDAFAALERVESAGADTLFCGHSHRPYVQERREGSIRLRGCNALLERLQQPRRGDRRADALRLSQGEAAVDALLQAVDPAHMGWARTAHRCCCRIGSPAWT